MTELASALAVFDPDGFQTRIFRAALCPPDVAFAELKAWEAEDGPDLVAYLSGPGKWMRGQLPLIYSNVSHGVAEVRLACRPYLKTATLRERKRYDMYRDCVRDALRVLNATHLPYCVVKAAAVANTVYASPYLRHCHDLDVVVRESDQPVFMAALAEAGFSAVTMKGAPGFSAQLDHPIGLPVMLHTRPVAGDTRCDAEWMLEGAAPVATEAGEMILPMPARRILHTWLHRFGCDRYQRQAWVPDTVLDLRKATDDDLECLNADLRRLPDVSEALASARYLSRVIGPMPQLDAIAWPARPPQEVSAQQRVRLMARARAQGVVGTFRSKLGRQTRRALRYDWFFPPAAHFELPSTVAAHTLWRHRARHVLHGLRRRLGAI